MDILINSTIKLLRNVILGIIYNFNFIRICKYDKELIEKTSFIEINQTKHIYLNVGVNQKYKSISEAVDEWLTTYNKAKAIIRIYAGEYNESIKIFGEGDINLSFIGEDKNKVIWITKIGYYKDAPLHYQGNGLIKGITFIADHSDNPKFKYTTLKGVSLVWNENVGGAYALHVDFQGNQGKTIIEDCILISYQNAALGCGTSINQTIELKNCDLYSYTDTSSIHEISRNGAMLYHTSSLQKQYNQKLIMHNVKFFSKYFKAIEYRVFSKEKNMSMVEFINCKFLSERIIGEKLVSFKGLGRVYLSTLSNGNNIEKCNKYSKFRN